MLDNVIHKHIDNMDVIERAMKEEIDQIMSNIDIDLIMVNPETELAFVVEAIKKSLFENHIPKAIEEGIVFAKNIEKDGEIIIQDTTNPTINQGVIENDKRRD